jgi:ferritin-like metal-binding protein YciE
MDNLNELFLEELADIYDAERQLVKALPKIAAAATSEELKNALEKHLEQTEVHVRRVEQVFEIFGGKAKPKKCRAMEGLLAEGEEILKEDMEPAVKDAAIIAAAQKVEHYEIASYGTLRTWAELLQKDEAVSLLDDTATEESEADDTLSGLAESINVEANEGETDDEEDTANRRGVRPKPTKR